MDKYQSSIFKQLQQQQQQQQHHIYHNQSQHQINNNHNNSSKQYNNQQQQQQQQQLYNQQIYNNHNHQHLSPPQNNSPQQNPFIDSSTTLVVPNSNTQHAYNYQQQQQQSPQKQHSHSFSSLVNGIENKKSNSTSNLYSNPHSNTLPSTTNRVYYHTPSTPSTSTSTSSIAHSKTNSNNNNNSSSNSNNHSFSNIVKEINVEKNNTNNNNNNNNNINNINSNNNNNSLNVPSTTSSTISTSTSPPIFITSYNKSPMPLPPTRSTPPSNGGQQQSDLGQPLPLAPLSISSSSVFIDYEHCELPPGMQYYSSNQSTPNSHSGNSSPKVQPISTTATNIPHRNVLNESYPSFSRTHKRYSSTSAVHDYQNNHHQNKSDPFNIPSKNNSQSNSPNTVSQSPLKSKFFKVISSVKSLQPQVDSLLKDLSFKSPSNIPMSTSHSNNGADCHEISSINSSLSSSPTQSLPPSKSPSPTPSNASNNNNNIKWNNNKKMESPKHDSGDHFYSYYGVNNNEKDDDQKSQCSTNSASGSPTKSLDSDDFEELIISSKRDSPTTTNNSHHNHSSGSESSSPNFTFKSNILNQVSSQQKKKNEDNHHHNHKTTTTTTNGYHHKNNNNHLSSPNTHKKSHSYPNISNDFDSPTISSKAIKEDILLQRFKPLPPVPFNQLNPSNQPQQSLSASNDNNNKKFINNYKKLSNILQMLSFKDQNSHSNISYPTSEIEKYKKDFSDYLSEYGDKIKIFQHIDWHLEQNIVNIDVIKLLGNHYGFSDASRATSWMLLNGYLPSNTSQRASVLNQKRFQYKNLVKKYFGDEHKSIIFNDNSSNQNNNNNNNNNSNNIGVSLEDSSELKQHNNNRKLIGNVMSELFTSMQNVNQEADSKKFENLIQQVHVDVIRTRPDGFVGLFELKEIEDMLKRILSIWSLENTDLSYFQGLNDLICPFLIVFLDQEVKIFNDITNVSYPNLSEQQYCKKQEIFKLEKMLGDGMAIVELKECGKVTPLLSRVEADVYWCISNLMKSIKHYASNTGCGLPAEGMMKKLELLVRESNPDLYKHFQAKDIDFSHFSFRWMVCFLTRDFNIETGIQLWDHYFCDAEGEGFSFLHICFCSSLLSLWTDNLLKKDFMELVQYLQKPPSLEFNHSNLQSLLKDALSTKQKYRDLLARQSF
ncbi:hypothetical protein CYY_007282 [Polysphondylium violaceum]|uniref:Rab-GAP TBC domain-containing protein n=1 Tax=Polysphondylium violaceum TaxID=133409 RepID=A0A8J4PPF2_9MYCE|nr:hypothetical protein CYY_007282 [Polysphondylium violaceum]